MAAESIANLKSRPGTGRSTGQAYRPAKRYRILGRRRAFACGTERATRNATLLAGARAWHGAWVAFLISTSITIMV